MKSIIIGLLAETNLHPGTESSLGVIDLPVARENSTGYPVIVGSSFKGALRDKAEHYWGKEDNRLKKIFGMNDNAGTIAITDARLLFLPVRSLTGHYKWVTCPYLLERLQRDSKMAGMPLDFVIPEVNDNEAISSDNNSTLFLEELSFSNKKDENNYINAIIAAISPLIKHQSCIARLDSQLVIISDQEFKYFATYGLQVTARNNLDKNKTSKNLWYEETIPADSLFYSLLITRPGKESSLEEMKQMFIDDPYLQVGGNETIGQGWCTVSCMEKGGAADE